MADNQLGDGSDSPNLNDLIPLSQAAEISGLSQPHLALLARKGDIWATKIGRNWVTTKAALDEYLARDRRPGPKSE